MLDECDMCDFLFACLPSNRNTKIELSRSPPKLWSKSTGINGEALGEPDIAFFNLTSHLPEWQESTIAYMSFEQWKSFSFSLPHVNFAMLAAWLEECRPLDAAATDHDKRSGVQDIKTQPSTPTTVEPMQLSVIDCVHRILVNMPADEEYVTLSYLWGSPSTGVEPLDDNGTLPPKLPATIEDSITVCIALGLRYLWIDRYVSRRKTLMNDVNRFDVWTKSIRILSRR
jgi:hypothetical protein